MDLKKVGADTPPPVPWEQIKRYDGRFDVLHFEQIPEDADEDSEWVYSLGEITLTEKPGNGGAVEMVAKLALPIAATYPPSQALGNNPLPTHFQLLLPSGKTGWVDVKAVQPFAVDKLCYGKGSDGEWKIVGYDQNS